MSCTDDNCFNTDIKVIEDLQYALKYKVASVSKSSIRLLKRGFDNSSEICLLSKLGHYKNTLDRIWEFRYANIEPCICPSEVQSLTESIKGVVDMSCCSTGRLDCIKDDSGFEAYIMANPECQSYDTWNKWSHYWCGELGFEVVVEKRACDIMLAISKEVLSCNLLYALQVKKQVCDLGFTVNRSKEECKIDWELLVEKTNCDLDFQVYFGLVCCGYSYDVIKSIIDTGANLSLDEGICDAKIETLMGTFSANEISPSNLSCLYSLGSNTTLNESALKTDYVRK